VKVKLQVLYNFLSKVSTQLNVFILSILLVRYLSKDSYGTYLQFQLTVNTCIYALTMGLPHSVYYFLPKAKNPRQYIFSIFFFLLMVGVSVAALIIFSDNLLGGLFNNPELNPFSVHISIAVICLLPFELIEPFFLSVDRNDLYSIFNAVVSVIFFLLVFIPLSLGYDLKEVFFGITCLYICQFAGLVYVLIKFSDKIPNRQNKETITIKKVFDFSFPISLSVFINKAAREIDRYIISIKFLPSQYAVYSRGAIHVPFIEMLPYSTNNVLMSKYTNYHDMGKFDEMFKLWRESIKKLSLIVYPCFSFLWIFAAEIIVILYTEQYRGSVPIFKIYLTSLIVKLAVYDSIIRVSGQTKYLSLLAVVSLVVNTAASLILLKYMGVRGPAIATIFVVILGVLIQLSITKSIFSVGWSDVYPFKELIKTMLVAIVSIVPIFIVKPYLGKITLLKLGVAFPTYIFIYICLAMLLKLISREELKELMKLMPFNKGKKVA